MDLVYDTFELFPVWFLFEFHETLCDGSVFALKTANMLSDLTSVIVPLTEPFDIREHHPFSHLALLMRDSWSLGLSIVYLVGLVSCSVVAGRLSSPCCQLTTSSQRTYLTYRSLDLSVYKAKSLLFEKVSNDTTGEAQQ